MNIFQELIVVAVFVLCQGDTKYFLMLMLQREVNQFSQFIPCPSSGFSANAISPVIISPKSLQSLKGHTTLNQIPSKQQLNWIITLKDYSISMLVQFLKSKYFPHANFLQTKGLNLFLQIHHSRQKSFFFFSHCSAFTTVFQLELLSFLSPLPFPTIVPNVLQKTTFHLLRECYWSQLVWHQSHLRNSPIPIFSFLYLIYFLGVTQIQIRIRSNVQLH